MNDPIRHLFAFATTTLLCTSAAAEPPLPRFTEAVDVIPLEARYRRKWDTPVVADFDQDGRLDLLLTDHSRSAQLFWNNGTTFSEPIVVVRGDTHGVAVGDYDRDGRIDLIVSRGGGGGKKPRNPVSFQINCDRTIEGGEEFAHFERTRGRAARLIDWDGDGLLDLALSAFPLKSQPRGANHLFHNQGDGRFAYVDTLPRAKWMGFRTLVTDFNSDGRSDLLLFGGADMVAVQNANEMGFSDVTTSILGPLAQTDHVSGLLEIDYDNDGDFDLFLTRADHPFDHKTYFDPEGQRFAFFARFKPSEPYDLVIDGDFHLDNLQMAFPHFDVLVGADKRLIEFDVDRHGHKELTLRPGEAEGWPAARDEKGLYIGHLGNGVWRIVVDTVSATAGVVGNVTSSPPTKPADPMPALLFENRDGRFADVTARVGIAIRDQTAGAVAGDFNNDGWSDLMVLRHGNPAKPTQHDLYLNESGQRFRLTPNHSVATTEVGATGLAAEAFDYDNDGDLDLILGSERGRWRLYRNDLEANENRHHITVAIGASPSGRATAQGAMLSLVAGGHKHRRVVGATSGSFSHSFNNRLHVGLGETDTIDSAEVRWTTGETSQVGQLAADSVLDAPFVGVDLK